MLVDGLSEIFEPVVAVCVVPWGGVVRAVQYRFLFWSYFSAIRRPGDIVLESSLDFVCSCCIL